MAVDSNLSPSSGLARNVYLCCAEAIKATALRELRDVPGLGDIATTDDPQDLTGAIIVAEITAPICRAFIVDGLTELHNQPPYCDAFELFYQGGNLVLLGNNPRGLLQAIYQLQDLTREHQGLPPADTEVRKSFQLRQRIFHARFDEWPACGPDVRYISHLGATHCLVTHDWQGDYRSLFAYVDSDIFPRAMDQKKVKENKAKMRQLVDHNNAYGLESALWMTELPCQGGPWVPEEQRAEFLTRFDAEVLSESGTYQGKVLCFSHPQVQEFYDEILRKFLSEFPEFSVFFVMGLDANGEFCDPETCPRCKGASKFAQRDRLLRFLIEKTQQYRPGMQILTTNWGWEAVDYDEFLTRQKQLPESCGVFAAAELDGWQPERQVHNYLLKVRAICRQKQQLFIGYDDLHWGDDSVHYVKDIQDFPLGISAKIKRWAMLEADGVFDHWGTWPEDISSNSIACREFFMDPHADAAAVCEKLALKQFGKQAGPLVLRAWDSLERAHRILSNASTWCPYQWPGWYGYRTLAPTPENFSRSRITTQPLIEKQAHGFTYNPKSLQESLHAVSVAWEKAFPYYRQGIACLDEAIALADDSPLYYAYWWSGAAPTPNRKQHLERQRLYLETVSTQGREIGLQFGLQAIYEATPNNPDEYRRLAQEMLQQDMQACLDNAALCRKIIDSKLGRHDGVYKDHQKWVSEYTQKARDIQSYSNAK